MSAKKITRKASDPDGSPDDDDQSVQPFQEDRLEDVRRSMEPDPRTGVPFANTGSLDQFLKGVTDKLKPSSQPGLRNLQKPDADSPPDLSPKMPVQPPPPATRRLFPFDKTEPFPGLVNSSQPPSVLKITRSSTDGASSPFSTTSLNKLAQRSEPQIISPFDHLSSRTERKPVGPFTNYESPSDQDFNDNPVPESLAARIRNGSVPAETLRLLITSSMSEAEVLSVCAELDVDWERVPGGSRDEKTLYLIGYFDNRETHLGSKQAIANMWSQLAAGEQEWGDSEARLNALQATLTEPVQEAKAETGRDAAVLSFLSHVREDFAQASLTQRVLVLGLSLVVVTLLAVIVFLVFPRSTSISKSPPETALPFNFPRPVALQLPGGWIFELEPGVVVDGSWVPSGPEWLQGTELCRLISLPWTRQLNAVYQTLHLGDELFLTMSNTDLLQYRVTELKTLDVVDLNSDVLTRISKTNTPCLAIVLTRADSGPRQMLVAVPVSAGPWQAELTASPAIAPSANHAFPTATAPRSVTLSPVVLSTLSAAGSLPTPTATRLVFPAATFTPIP